MYNFSIDFEYDLNKSENNLKKHGISFEEAKHLWLVPAVEVEAKTEDEPRFIRIGKLNGKFYSCIFTVRKGRVRIISVRRSRREEQKIYWEKMKDEENKEKDKGKRV